MKKEDAIEILRKHYEAPVYFPGLENNKDQFKKIFDGFCTRFSSRVAFEKAYQTFKVHFGDESTAWKSLKSMQNVNNRRIRINQMKKNTINKNCVG